MTSLAHQLKRLALPQNEPSLLSRRETASVLFEPKDAASMDGSTFHALGCTGLEELLGIEPAFAEFQQTLFSQASLSMERSVQDRAVNKQLDKGISLFLARLSPYFLLKPALKCLEWLIHRFHIHLYNQDSLIACVLPYHETKVFVRVIQLLKIDDPTHRWHWLHGLQKPGVPLARGTLLTHCYKDLSFMDFVCTLVTKSVKVDRAVRDGQCLQLRVVFSFYAAAIVPSLEAVEKVTDSVIAKLLPYVHLGLKSELVDYKAATYMIVAQLAVKVVMQAELADSLAVQVSRSLGRVPVLASEGLACLIILLQNQKEATLGPKPVAGLCSDVLLGLIAASYDISPLLHYLLPQLVHSVFACHGNHFYMQGLCPGDSVGSVSRYPSNLNPGFSGRCPTALDAIFEGHMSAQRSEQQKKLLHHFLSLTMSCGKYQVLPDSDTSLLLSLNHPLSSVRNMAVDYLKEVLISGKEGFDEAFLKDALLERLKDDDPEVVMSAVSALQVRVLFCSAASYKNLGALSGAVPYLVLEEVVRMLDDPRLTAGSPDLCTRIGWKLLPFLLVTNPAAESPELQLALCVSKTHLLSQHPLTRGWANGIHTHTHVSEGFKGHVIIRSFTTDAQEPWWNPEKLDASTCCYLQLLCRLLDMVVGGANRGPLAPSFRALLQPLLQVHLQATEHLFRFLPLLWVYGSNLGDQLEFRVTPLLQARALYVGRALLVSVPAGSREALASASSPVVPSLLACLGCAVAEVRRAALAVLQLLAGTTASPYCPLVEKLLSAAEELISDPSYLSQALGRLYEEAMSSGKSGTRLLAAVEQLLRCVQSPDCPCYVATVLLQALRDVNGEFVLSTLLPAMERLLEQRASDAAPLLPDEALLLSLLLGKYTASAAPLLTRHPRSLELFLTALGTSSAPRPGITTWLIPITKPFFAALADEKVQQRILGVLFDVLVDTKDPACSQTLSSVFKGITVDAELVSNELTPTNKPRVSASVQQTRRSKLQLKKALDATPEEGAVSWPRVTLILELLQHKKKLRRPQMLVPTLFNLLARCLEASLEQENMEYTKQLLLSVLLNVCQKLSPHGGAVSKDVLDEDKFSVELVVQCVRTSVVPQTHHHALLLLSTVAGIFPEKVLHNVMAIFTFMGANVMRLDDSYSLQVISRTVQAVIPALIRAHEGASASSQAATEAAVTRLLRVFVDALPHVPEHRRLPVLHQLLSALGPARFLWVLLLLLFEQHTGTSSSRAASEKEAALEQDQEFWVSVCCEFEVQEQLTSFIKILQFLMALPKDKEQGKGSESVADLIFSVEAHSGKELRHFKFLALSFMGQLLASGGFVGKVSPLLLEETLRYIHAVALCVEQNSEQPTAKFWRALLTKSYDILDKVNALLPMDTFITVVRGLMGNQLPSVRRKALELLNNRLQHRTQWEEPQVAMLLELIGDLLSIVDRHRAQASCQEEEEQAINRQTALYGLKLMCRSFGAGHQEAFLPVLSRTVELVANPEEERNVMGSALLCVAEVTSTLKALAIPQIHRLMPAVLQALKERKELLSNEVYLLSAVTALQKTAETLPHFISPYLEGTVSQVTHTHTPRLPSCPQLTARLASLSSTLATKVSSRVLLPTITRCYSSMVDSQKSRLGPLLNILKEHIGHMEKDQLASHQSELSSFFLSALDYRAKHCQGNLEKTAEIEGYVIDCLLVMVMKLSEVTFRPLFFKLFNWSKTEGASKERMLTFCRLADRLADKLKGLFVLFAGQLVKPFSDLLRQLNATLTDDVFFTSENDDDDIDNDGEESNVQKSCLLLEYMLDCLHKIFLYDTQRFLSKERADALLGSLVDQLENVLGGEDVYQTRVIKHLVPCIAQFAVAMGDDSHWKVLNYKILLKTRHSSPKVRFSALVMILELAGKLKENYMVLLPETVPFLAELMEDECEEVEYHVQNVIQEMETILGESLQSYF
uniref:HEAT repeat-containing protein 1 n=1 Tax=Electrophorus electricus TaxID=8005 RepID=A0A4W4GBE1_ELEEL